MSNKNLGKFVPIPTDPIPLTTTDVESGFAWSSITNALPVPS